MYVSHVTSWQARSGSRVWFHVPCQVHDSLIPVNGHAAMPPSFHGRAIFMQWPYHVHANVQGPAIYMSFSSHVQANANVHVHATSLLVPCFCHALLVSYCDGFSSSSAGIDGCNAEGWRQKVMWWWWWWWYSSSDLVLLFKFSFTPVVVLFPDMINTDTDNICKGWDKYT